MRERGHQFGGRQQFASWRSLFLHGLLLSLGYRLYTQSAHSISCCCCCWRKSIFPQCATQFSHATHRHQFSPFFLRSAGFPFHCLMMPTLVLTGKCHDAVSADTRQIVCLCLTGKQKLMLVLVLLVQLHLHIPTHLHIFWASFPTGGKDCCRQTLLVEQGEYTQKKQQAAS